VEAIVPVESPELRARLWEILDVALADDARSWSLQPDGRWRPPSPGGVFNAQNKMQELALARSGRRGADPETAT
jgi:polyphosphate kinase